MKIRAIAVTSFSAFAEYAEYNVGKQGVTSIRRREDGDRLWFEVFVDGELHSDVNATSVGEIRYFRPNEVK